MRRQSKELKEAISTPISRLREFVAWTVEKGLTRGESDFERKCQLSPRYISNNMSMTKGNLTTETLRRIISVFPQLNLSWLCSGEGLMILKEEGASAGADYREAFRLAMKQIDALRKIIARYEA